MLTFLKPDSKGGDLNSNHSLRQLWICRICSSPLRQRARTLFFFLVFLGGRFNGFQVVLFGYSDLFLVVRRSFHHFQTDGYRKIVCKPPVMVFHTSSQSVDIQYSVSAALCILTLNIFPAIVDMTSSLDK